MYRFSRMLFAAAACCATLLPAGCDRNDTGRTAEDGPAVKVVTMQPKQMEFIQKIRVQANVESQESAEISSRTSGNLDLIPVGEGDRVKKGDLLFQVDRINLENNVKSQKQNVEVAEAELHIARINLNLARTVRDKAKVDFDRAERLKSRTLTNAQNSPSTRPMRKSPKPKHRPAMPPPGSNRRKPTSKSRKKASPIRSSEHRLPASSPSPTRTGMNM